MESYHFFQIEIENSYFVPFRRPLTKQRTRKAPVDSHGFVEPIESALERCAWRERKGRAGLEQTSAEKALATSNLF
eukprot:scaffold30400_cov36-Attheya_sp.AAC.1